MRFTKNFGFQLQSFHCCKTNSKDPVTRFSFFCRISVLIQTLPTSLLLFSFCPHSDSHLVLCCTYSVLIETLSTGLLLFQFCPHVVPFCTDSVLIQTVRFCPNFRFSLRWINSSHKMAKTQLINFMESRISHAKLGFVTTARFSTPTAKRSTKIQENITMKRSTSLICGDPTIIFM